MSEFNIFVMYLYYCHKNNMLLVLVLKLGILPVTSQPPKPAIPLGKEKQRPLFFMVSVLLSQAGDWR